MLFPPGSREHVLELRTLHLLWMAEATRASQDVASKSSFCSTWAMKIAWLIRENRMDLQYLWETYEPTRIVGKKQHLLESSFLLFWAMENRPLFQDALGCWEVLWTLQVPTSPRPKWMVYFRENPINQWRIFFWSTPKSMETSNYFRIIKWMIDKWNIIKHNL